MRARLLRRKKGRTTRGPWRPLDEIYRDYEELPRTDADVWIEVQRPRVGRLTGAWLSRGGLVRYLRAMQEEMASNGDIAEAGGVAQVIREVRKL